MDRAVRGIQTASPMLSRPVNISDVTFSFLGFVFGKISGKSCRAGLDTVVALDLREGYAGGSWASRKHEPSPRRRLGPLGRDAAESGDGGLPPPSRTESAARVGAPQPPLPSRGAEIRGKCGVDVRNVSYSRFGPATADRGSRGIRDQPRNPPTDKRSRINFPFPCPSFLLTFKIFEACADFLTPESC